MPRSILVFGDISSLSRLIRQILRESKISDSKFIYEIAEAKKVGIAGISSGFYRWINHQGWPNLVTLFAMLKVTNYTIVLVPKERLKEVKHD